MSLATMIRHVTGTAAEKPIPAETADDPNSDPNASASALAIAAAADVPNGEDDPEDDPVDPKDSDGDGDEDNGGDESMAAGERRAFAAGQTAERKRIGTILGSEAADRNPKLAAHLAFATSDSAEKALAALNASEPQANGNPLSERMNSRGASALGRGGEAQRPKDGAQAWAGALKKAGVAKASK
jgi:hypothetical protein